MEVKKMLEIFGPGCLGWDFMLGFYTCGINLPTQRARATHYRANFCF